MKRFVLSLLCYTTIACIYLFLCPRLVAQSTSEKVYTVVERQPEFPGGKAALSMYLAENIEVPGALVRNGPNIGPVSAKFIIDELGYVHDIRVATKPLDKKAQKGMHKYMTSIIAAVEKMPRWRSGEVGGKPVPVFYTLPIEVHMPY